MKIKEPYNGPWPWRLTARFSGKRISFYSLYFNEEPQWNIKIDTPAYDKQKHFLWCTNVRNLDRIRENSTKKLAKFEIKHGVDNSSIDIVKALKGFDYDRENTEHWKETLDLVNIILDYLEFLPKDDEDEKTIRLLEMLSIYLFEGTDLSLFYNKYKTSKRRIIEQILYCLYRIYQNSRIV